MKEWILIAEEHCPKCKVGMVQAYTYSNENHWRGGEKLRCTQNDCDLTGEVVPDGKVFKCNYELTVC